MKEKREKRIALAKDVLARLDAEELIPGFGNYCIPRDAKCDVCATGALVVACCGIPTETPRGGLGEDDVIQCLAPFFDANELALIEAAFEGRCEAPLSHYCTVPRNDLKHAAMMFRRPSFAVDEALEAEGRLRAIMQNIIENNGVFRP